MNKRIGKAILAMIIALSVAILPATAGFAAGGNTAEVSASALAPDCDQRHDIPNNTTQKSTDGCDSMAGCALKCFTASIVGISGLTFSSSPSVAVEPVRMESKVTSRIGNPPFRPPRA
jgi:hypothetical protein